MKTRFGKIARVTIAMAMVLALVPVLAVGSPVAAVVNNNNGCCDGTVVTVCPAIVACESGGSEDKEFTVENNGECDIYRIEFSVPAAYTLLETGLTWDAPSDWYLDKTVSGGEVLILKFWTFSNPIPYSGTNWKQFVVYDVGIPVGSSGVYWWDWEAWDTSHKGCEPPNDECPGAEDAKCSGSAKQSVDCEWPVIVAECLGIECDCEVLADPVENTLTATITDPEGNLDFDSVKLYGVECSACVEPCGEVDCASSGECCSGDYHSCGPDRFTPITDGWEFEWDIHSLPSCTHACYYIEASDKAEPAHTSYWPDCDDPPDPSTRDGCCKLHADGDAPTLTIEIKGNPNPPCFTPCTDVTFVVTSTEMTYKDDGDDRVETAPTVEVDQPTLVDEDITTTAVLILEDPLTWEYTFHVNEDCDHTATVSGEDCVGNVAELDEVDFYGDGTGPPAPILGSEVCPLEIILTWDGVCDDDMHDACQCVDHYIVYRDGAPLEPTVPHTGCSNPHEYIDTGYHLEDGTLYCYRVSAVDCLGNEGPKSNERCEVYTESRPAHEHTITDLCLGWNLISLPKVPVDPATEVILAGVLNNSGDPDDPDDGEAVWTYNADPEAAGDPWSYLKYTEAGFVGDLTEMRDGPGYWLFLLDPYEEITVYGWDMAAGGGAVPPLYDVYPGWNLIGFKSQEEMCPVEYLWRLLVADASGSAIFAMGCDIFEEWWYGWGAAMWFAHVEAWGDSDLYPSELDWYTWWEMEGAAAFDAFVGQYYGSTWKQMEVSLELQFENLLMMLFAYDCDCEFLDYYVPFTMEPGSGYWLYVPDGGEILPIEMEYLFFLQVMGGGLGHCPGGVCP